MCSFATVTWTATSYDEPGQVQTTRISIRSDGNPGECQPSFPEPCSIGQDTQLVAMSDDGRHVVMHTWRVLKTNDTNGFRICTCTTVSRGGP